METHFPLVLQLDVAGNPNKWITYEKAAYYSTKGLIAWSLNDTDFMLRGGKSRITGEQSTLTLDTIIAVRSKLNKRQLDTAMRVPLNNKTLFRRDQNVCGYCGERFHTSKLSRDHIIPTSKGGPNTWTNVITACHGCNEFKDDKLLSQTSMKLVYVPYTPSKSEYLILQNRQILANQMDFLLSRVSDDSRLLKN